MRLLYDEYEISYSVRVCVFKYMTINFLIKRVLMLSSKNNREYYYIFNVFLDCDSLGPITINTEKNSTFCN